MPRIAQLSLVPALAMFAFASSLFGQLSLSPNAANASAGGASNGVQVIATDQSISWTVSVNQPWVTITSGATGRGNGNFTYSVAGNPAATSRVATITVTPSNGTSPTLALTQLGGILNISPSSANADPLGASGSIAVYTEDSSLQWTAVSSDGWVTITSGSSGIGARSIQWTASANPGVNRRSAIISVTPLNGIGQPFVIDQQGGSGATISLSPSSVSLDATSGTGAIQVSATSQSLAWSAASNQTWFTIAGASGTGKGSISYSFSANPSAASRTAIVTVTPVGAPAVAFTATQSGGVLTVTPSSTNIGFIGRTGSTTIATADNALQWTAASNQTWLTITSGTPGTGSGTVQWSTITNTTNTPRSANITVTPSGGSPQSVSVNQEAGQPTGTISLSPSSLNVPASISNGSISVISSNPNLSWTASSSDTSWLTLAGTTGTGNGSFSYTGLGNPKAADRTATITVTPANGVAATLTVTQIAAVMTVSPSSANVQGSGGTGSFSITANNSTLQWSAASNVGWLSITSPGSGVGDATMAWAAAANSSTTARTGIITITPSGGSGQTFTVTEAGLTGSISASPSAVSFSYQQLGSIPASAQVTISTNGPAFAFTATASSTGDWLLVSAGGNAPAVITLSVNPGSLPAGTYSGSVIIASLAATANSPFTIPVPRSLCSPAPVLTSQPNAVSFAYQQNGRSLANQSVSLISAAPIDYSIVQDATAPWLFASGTGPSPSTITISVNPANLQAGSFQGAVTLVASRAGNSPLSIPVSLTVSPAPSLTATPVALSVSYRQLDPLPPAIDFLVASSGSALDYLLDISPSTPWLRVLLASHAGSGTTSDGVTLGIDPTGLSPGAYQGAAILGAAGAGNSPLVVPITLTVTIVARPLTASPAQLTVGITQGAAAIVSRIISLTSDSPANFTATASTTTGGNWLSVEATGAGTPSSLTVSIQSGSLAPGAYNGTITVTSSQAGNSPLAIPVTLTVSPQPQLDVSPPQVSFYYQLLSGPPPPQQSLTVSASTPGSPVSVIVSTTSGGSWLASTGGLSTPGVLPITADPTGLSAGVYSGSITLVSSGYATTTIPVTFRVTASPVFAVQPPSLEFAYQTGNDDPPGQTLAVGTSSTKFAFSAASSEGAPWLQVVGGGNTPASVSVAVHTAGLLPGSYTASVALSSAQAGNSPVLVPVHLIVTAGLVIGAQPTALSFTYTLQGTAPAAQPIGLSGSSRQRALVNFTTSITPATSWLSLSGNGPTPASLEAMIDPTGLTPGVYGASIVVSAPAAANTPLILPVTLTVKAAPTIAPSAQHLTFSYQLLDDAPANQILTVTASDPSLVVTASASTDSGNWLSVIGGGNAPVNFSITANPAGLTAGTYNGSVTLDALNGGNTPLVIPVTLVVSEAPVVRAAPGALTFSYTVGDSNPAATTVQISSSKSAIAYDVTAGTDAGGPWLQVSNGGTTPGAFSATVTSVGLAPGTYTGTISIASATAGNSPLLIPVTLTVTTSTALTAAPASVTLSAQQGVQASQTQIVHIGAGNTSIPVTYEKSPGADWLTVSGRASAAGDLTISASAANLPAGRYSAVILVLSQFASNSPLIIPVTFDISRGQPVFQTNPASLTFAYTISGTKPPGQSVTLTSSGAQLDFSASVLPGATWLFSSVCGRHTRHDIGYGRPRRSVHAGVYTGTVVITSPSSPNTTTTVPVILTVSNAPLLSTEPLTQTFSYQIGGPNPTARGLVVNSSGNSAIPVSASATTLNGGNWLAVTIVQGTTPATALASVNPAGLAAGTYNGQIQFTSPNAANSPLTVPITLTVSTAPTINTTQSRFLFSYQAGGTPPPNQQVILRASDGSTLPLTAVVSNGFSAISASLDVAATPAVLTVSVSPGILSHGVYESSVVVTSVGGSGPLVIPVILTISPQPVLIANPSTATFGYQAGGAIPPPTSVTINSSGDPLPFTISLTGGDSWLTATGGGTTPSPIQISVNPIGLPPGLYNALIVVSSSAAGNNPLQIVVLLSVGVTPLLTSSPPSLVFNAISPILTGSQSLSIGSTSGTPAFTTSVSSATPWLSVSGSGTAPGNALVSVNAAGLSPGTYQGAVQIASPGVVNSPLSVPVTLVVSAVATLQASPTPLNFSYKAAGPLPSPQTVNLTLGGQPASGTIATPSPGSPWLSVSSTTGALLVSANPSGLIPGTYTGNIAVASPGASNSPLTVPVNFTVQGIPELDVSQDNIAVTILQPESAPVSTTINLTTGSNPPVNFTLDVTASTWFRVTPLSGTTPTAVTVTADPTGLRPGNYSGSVSLHSSGMKLRTLGLNLTVATAPTLNTSPPFLVFQGLLPRRGSLPTPSNIYVGRFDTGAVGHGRSKRPLDHGRSNHSFHLQGRSAYPYRRVDWLQSVYHGSIALTIVSGFAGTPPPAATIPVTLYVDQPANPRIDGVVTSTSYMNSGPLSRFDFQYCRKRNRTSDAGRTGNPARSNAEPIDRRRRGFGERNSLPVAVRVLHVDQRYRALRIVQQEFGDRRRPLRGRPFR